MLRRLGALAGAVVASLALAVQRPSRAHHADHEPDPALRCAGVTASWTPSIPDPGGQIIGYRVDLGDLTTGTSTAYFTVSLQKILPGLINGHKYVVRVRAMQFRNGVVTYSALVRPDLQEALPDPHRPGQDRQRVRRVGPEPAVHHVRPRLGRPARRRPGDPARRRPSSCSRAPASRRSRSRPTAPFASAEQVTGSHQRRGAMSSCIFCGPWLPGA